MGHESKHPRKHSSTSKDCKCNNKHDKHNNKSNNNKPRIKLKCDRKKCRDNNKVIKAVIPRILLNGNDIQDLTIITTDTQALAYITPLDSDSGIYNPDTVINMGLDLSATGDVRNIDHVALDLHVSCEQTQDIVFNMYLSQTVWVDDQGEEGPVKQSQQYLYQGHRYTLVGRQWNKIGERWDRPRNLGILSATNLPDDAELVKPRLEISLLGVEGRLIVDQTIQLHVEYCKEDDSEEQ